MRAQARIELLDDVGDVGRMELGEGLVRNGELDLLGGTLEQVHIGPGDDVLGERLAEHLRHLHAHALEQRVDGAQKASGAHLGAEQAQLVVAGGRQFDVVHSHDLHALRVDDLLVHDVAREENLVGLEVGEADVGGGILEVHAVLVKALDVLAPRDHEGRLARTLEGQRGDAGEDLARGDAQVVHDTDFLASRIHDRESEHFGKVVHSAPSICRCTPAGAHLPRCARRSHSQGSATVWSGFRFHLRPFS